MSPNTEFSFDHFPTPYQSLDANGKILHVNKDWLDILGYTEQEVIGKPFSAFLSPDSASSFKGKFARFKENGWVRGVEFMMVRMDGREIIIQFDGYVEKDDKNKFKRTHCIFRDITEKRKLESALRDNEQFSADIFNAIQDGISVLDKDLTVVRVNALIEEMYADYMPIVGKKCYQAYQGRKSICPWCPSKQSLEDGNQHTVMVPYPNEEDPKGWIELTSYPLLDADGKITGVIEHVKDITGRVQAEQRIAHLNLALQSVSNVNKLIIREKNRDVLIRKACNTLTETRGFNTAWIMVLNKRGKYVDSAESGIGKGFTLLLKELKQGKFPACVKQALADPGPVEINDPSSTCTNCPVGEKYSKKGRMTIRLEYAEKIYGILSVSFGINITVDEEELSLFEELANDIAFALYSIETEQERDEAEAELLLKNLVFDVSISANSIADTQGILTYVNEAFLDIWGYSNKEEVIGKPISDFLSSNDEANKIISALNETGTWERGYTALKKDKTTFDAYGFGTVIKDKSGNIIGYQSAVQDITEQKQADQKLRVSEEYQKTVFETTPLATIIIEEDTILSMVNMEFEKLSGYSKEELEGKKSWSEFVAPKDLKRMKDYHKQRRIDPETTINQYEFQFIDREGNVRNISLSVDMVPGTKKSVASLLDITEKVQSQQQIELLLNISRQASAETSLDNLLFFIANQIVDVIPPAETSSIFLYNKERKVLEIQAWTGFPDSEVEGLEFPIYGTQIGRIFRSKKPALINNVSESFDFEPLDGPIIRKIKSQIAIPLIYKKSIIGIIYADNLTRTDVFSQKDLDLLESIGNQLAGVIENARLLDQVRESEEQYHSIVDDSPGLINRFLPDGTITFVNQGYSAFFGKNSEELIGTNIKLLIREEDRESVMSTIASLTKKSPIKISENKKIRRDGEIRWIRWTDRALFDEKGKVISYQSFGEDITESKQAQRAIQQERDKAQKYLDIAEVMIVAIDKDGEITLVNQKGASILGYQIEELIGKNWFNTCVPEMDRKQAKKIFDEFITGGMALGDHFEQTVITKSGEKRIIDWHSTPLWEQDDVEKHRIGSLNSGEDITKRVKAEKELGENEEKLRNIIDNSTNMFYSHTPDHQLTFISPQSKQLLGYKPDEMLIKWTDLTTDNPINQKGILATQKAIDTGETQPPYELELVNKNGKIIIVETREAPVVRDGKTVAIVGSLTDITERVRTGKLLNALNQAAVAMGTSQTQEEIFNVVSEELKQLNISCMLFPLDETRSRLITKFISHESAIIKPLEKLVGLKYKKYSFPIDTVDVYRRVIKKKETLLEDTSEHTVRQMFPKLSKKIITLLVKISQGKKAISTPLIVENEAIGMLLLQSGSLTLEDVPTAIAFADQLSSAWNKIGLLQNLRKTVEGTIHTIAATVEARDPYTAGHQKRVADLTVAISKEMGLPKDQIESIRMASLIHDLGKINIPAEILSKPGKLNELEFNLIKTHPQNGFDLLKEIEFPWPIAEMVLQHHEKMDGSGYPQGLKGDDILLEARILAVADIIEAMSSHRPYRPALGIEKALAQIKEERGTLLDPNVVDVCLKIFKEGYQLLED